MYQDEGRTNMSEEKKNAVELDDQALGKVAGGNGGDYDEKPTIQQASCIGCFACADTCPVDAIYDDCNLAQIDLAQCISCGACEGVCPTGAIMIP